ncbi:helix loop helix transcription factor [Cryphonectria parasitica EP155]|uniref:Helix loop helix transcription factor n=1 Tax=Cryphonectria parasitica (strain ATCC 38755 / EP155) TaxID=660469 RepID=A0A9P4Y1G9_CRYP1|nr:helix loop helix transcription factor [Cryphonectria parasitica EP155]KAF3765264.1 helix loop helix transcription factor [Cryphonectria parasitica EP155]
MAQQAFGHFGGGHASGSINPNDLNFNQGFQNNFGGNSNNQNNAFSSGSAVFGDDELLEGLGSPTEAPSGMQGHDFGGMNEMNMNYNQNSGVYNSRPSIDQQQHMPGFSNTPDGDPIQSPFVSNVPQYQSIHAPQFHTPMSYGGSPIAEGMPKDPNDSNFMQARQRLQAQAMQRKASTARSPLTPKMGALGLSMGSQDGFGAQPIRAGGAHHTKAPSGHWAHTPNSMTSFPGSGLSSPLQTELHSAQINGFLMKGTSMPTKLGGQGGALSSQQEAKKKRRRESHNLVERRRRDNINERIQDLSKLVPTHRLEDEKIRKMISNGTPMSPTLTGNSNPGSATSGLAGPGARRATSGNTGNITTGLPLEDKDKGPNKGDILNGAVSWTRDLMWMLQTKIQQQEELVNALQELGGQAPFDITEDEKRMQTELLEAMAKNELSDFTYSRTSGTGLRVPNHTDYKGEPLNGTNHSGDLHSISPEGDVNGHFSNDALDANTFWDDGEEDIKFNLDSYEFPAKNYGDLAYRTYGKYFRWLVNGSQALLLLLSVGNIIISNGYVCAISFPSPPSFLSFMACTHRRRT